MVPGHPYRCGCFQNQRDRESVCPFGPASNNAKAPLSSRAYAGFNAMRTNLLRYTQQCKHSTTFAPTGFHPMPRKTQRYTQQCKGSTIFARIRRIQCNADKPVEIHTSKHTLHHLRAHSIPSNAKENTRIHATMPRLHYLRAHTQDSMRCR